MILNENNSNRRICDMKNSRVWIILTVRLALTTISLLIIGLVFCRTFPIVAVPIFAVMTWSAYMRFWMDEVING